MNIKHLFFSLFAVAALAGCSSDENVVDNSGSKDSGSRYLSVNIVSTQSGTRAAGDKTTGDPGSATYEEGDENTVSGVRFYFFNSNGEAALVKKTSTGYVNYADATPGDNGSDMPNVEKLLNAVVILDYDNGDKKPAKMVAVVNPDKVASALGTDNKSLSDLEGIYADYSATGSSTDKAFLMTSSVYVDESTKVIAVDLEDENLQQTEALAEAHPVDVYVERVLAKVRFNQTTNLINTDGYIEAKNSDGSTITTADGQQLYIKLTGWDVTAKIDKSNLFKKVQTTWDASKNWGTNSPWTYSAYHRSYWAQNPKGAAVAVPTLGESAKNGGYSAYTFSKSKFDGKECVYVQENAANKDDGTKDNTTTKVIIGAQLYTKSGDSYSEASIYEYADQRFLTEDNCKTTMLTGLDPNIYKETTDGTTTGDKKYTRISANEVELKSAIESGMVKEYNENGTGSYKSYLNLTADAKSTKWYSITNDEAKELTETEVNEKLSAVYAKVYKSGHSYFYFDIQHLGYGVDGATFGQYGVVRNHIYECNLNAIYGIGTPVPSDSEIIVPEKPSKNVYVAAKINILSWRIVPNNITLEW